ncbi:MAG: DUF3299 domain-containing protein [Bdellovibrionales bacterium]|nr:DUF3299 domain-containing protein [Bdellovibrionales bacterium]
MNSPQGMIQIIVVGIAGIVCGLVIFDSVPFFGGSSTAVREALKDPDGIPQIDWRWFYDFDPSTGKGPAALLALDGEVVKVPGYIVPLSDDYSSLQEFVLVPDAQACIHVPPPPPNLIVTVKLREAIPSEVVSNPAWVTGVFSISTSKSEHGESSYKLDGVKMERFTRLGH